MGKMFALIPLERIPLQINLKCNPEHAVEMRERYEAVQPGYHMNKKHWNTILVDGALRNELIKNSPNEYEIIIHKHSPVCPLSHSVNLVLKDWSKSQVKKKDELNIFRINVILSRTLSGTIENDLNVIH